MELTKEQIQLLLSGAGPGLTPNQVAKLQAAVSENKPITAEGLELLFIPANNPNDD
jgi:hypothetical protein